MKNLKLIKAKGKGWFVYIDDGIIKNRLAFTATELWALAKVVTDRSDEILADMGREDK
jgi:hypothetical protein